MTVNLEYLVSPAHLPISDKDLASIATREAFYGHAGIPGHRGGSLPRSASVASTAIQSQGGVTISLNGKVPESGFVVAGVTDESGKRTECVFEKAITAADVADYMKTYSPILSKPGFYLGGWKDGNTGKVYLDTPEVLDDKNVALQVAKSRGELAVFDLSSIKTGTDGTIYVEEGANVGWRFHLFAADANPQDVADALNATQESFPGHHGVPGQRGGSAPRDGGPALPPEAQAAVAALVGKEDPWRYFHKHPDAQLLPLDKVISTKDQSLDEKYLAGQKAHPVATAAKAMASAYEGQGFKRGPINVRSNQDGTYTVQDGNATTQAAQGAGWEKIPALVDATAEAYYGHPGRPGQVGGSLPRSSGLGAFGKNYPGGPHQLAADALAARAAAKAPMAEVMRRLNTVADKFDGATVIGRLKGQKSIMEKVDKQPGDTPFDLKDIAATRITVSNLAEEHAAVTAIRDEFGDDITREKDNLDTPRDGYYRSFHFNINQDGQEVEIQVRTPNQTKLADWAHETLYKDHHPNAEQIALHRPTLEAYAVNMGEHFHRLDTGRDSQAPPCTQVVSQTIGCL